MTRTPAVLVMAKLPRPGAVKTRLAPLLGDEGAAELHAILVTRAVAVAREVAPSTTLVAVDPPGAESDMAVLVPGGVAVFAQYGRHLGERMATAIDDVHTRVGGPVVVVGADIPLLSAGHLRDAIDALQRDEVVLGPAIDGGYYLIGLATPRPELFAIDSALWGGPSVLAATLEQVRTSGLSVSLLEALSDLDTPGDAMAIFGSPHLPDDVRHVLARAFQALASRGRDVEQAPELEERR